MTAKNPASKNPASKNPAAKNPAAKKPAAKNPAAKKPAASPAASPATPTFDFTFIPLEFERSLRPGDVVRVASECGVRMTIERVCNDDFGIMSARCVWITPDGRAEHNTIALAALVRVS